MSLRVGPKVVPHVHWPEISREVSPGLAPAGIALVRAHRSAVAIFGLRTVALRQSCIYGTRQFGIEDQGWVAWFTIATVLKKQITIYGDGKQIRDILHVDDLVRAYDAAFTHADKAAGMAFNIGGGPENTLSLLELLVHLETKFGRKIELTWDKWRPGDQPVFVCDIARAGEVLGWQPAIGVREGVESLADWVQQNESLFAWLKT